VAVKVVRKILPVDGMVALTVAPAALTLTAPVGATATLAPALTTAGVIVIVPPELGVALLRSERSWVLLETETAGPEPRRLFTTVVALLETFAVTEPTVESGAVPVKPETRPPLRLAPKSPTWPTVLTS
jgi:hypothetical protein